MLTVVELDVVPVDEVSNGSVNRQVSPVLVPSRREPGCDRGVRYDVVAWMNRVH